MDRLAVMVVGLAEPGLDRLTVHCLPGNTALASDRRAIFIFRLNIERLLRTTAETGIPSNFDSYRTVERFNPIDPTLQNPALLHQATDAQGAGFPENQSFTGIHQGFPC